MARQHLLKRSSPTKGVPRESQAALSDRCRRQIPRPLPLAIMQVKNVHKITPSSISPYSQHFIFSLLPTFLPRFLPPPYSAPPPSNLRRTFLKKTINDKNTTFQRLRTVIFKYEFEGFCI